ncbi:MAG: SecC motif-containing protein [Gammaproteobacteria bacterium]|jgi:SEC-C motif-containing protein|nr:MAG: SecC motif-containing protein [Gammaproteobacteria bacterium]PHR85024.1 MAG: SecC motif-containing protein [Colwellia sp.]
MKSIQLCFCGSNFNFSSCCQPYINKEVQVQTAEQLMRSRFSAYAIGNAQYIYDTYAKSSRAEQSVEDIDDWSKSCLWIALKIYPIANSVNNTTEQLVEFSAFYITNNTLCELREKSRFILEESIATNSTVKEKATLNSPLKQWRYIDGDIIAHSELTMIKRNELCPCNYYPTAWQSKKGKKFKHCCGK